MFRVFVFGFLILFSAGFLSSCDSDKDARIQQLTEDKMYEKKQKEKEKAAREEAEKERERVRKEREKDRADKEKAEKDLVKAESSKKLTIGVLLAAMLVVLIIGIAIGSKARKDSESLNSDKKGDAP